MKRYVKAAYKFGPKVMTQLDNIVNDALNNLLSSGYHGTQSYINLKKFLVNSFYYWIKYLGLIIHHHDKSTSNNDFNNLILMMSEVHNSKLHGNLMKYSRKRHPEYFSNKDPYDEVLNLINDPDKYSLQQIYDFLETMDVDDMILSLPDTNYQAELKKIIENFMLRDLRYVGWGEYHELESKILGQQSFYS